MPANARVWVYQSNTILTEEQTAAIVNQGNEFINNWAAHGAALNASFDVLYKRFIIIGVDEKQAQASGCSIDKSLAFIKLLEQEFKLQLLDRMQVAYRKNDTIEVCSLKEFEKLANNGAVDAATIVFNNMITTKGEFDSDWEVPLKQSWQSRVLN